MYIYIMYTFIIYTLFACNPQVSRCAARPWPRAALQRPTAGSCTDSSCGTSGGKITILDGHMNYFYGLFFNSKLLVITVVGSEAQTWELNHRQWGFAWDWNLKHQRLGVQSQTLGFEAAKTGLSWFHEQTWRLRLSGVSIWCNEQQGRYQQKLESNTSGYGLIQSTRIHHQVYGISLEGKWSSQWDFVYSFSGNPIYHVHMSILTPFLSWLTVFGVSPDFYIANDVPLPTYFFCRLHKSRFFLTQFSLLVSHLSILVG